MNKEQFFKVLDGVDDKLLKGVFDGDGDADRNAEPESKHGAVYRPERRPRGRLIVAVSAACLAVAVSASFAVKAGFLGQPVRDTSVLDPTNAAESAVNSSSDVLRKDEESLSMGCMVDVRFSEEDDFAPFSPTRLEITEPGTVTATLNCDFSPDYKMPVDNIPYCVYVFADGKPIEFAPAGTDDYAARHDYSMDESNITLENATTAVFNDGTSISGSRYSDTIKIDFAVDEHTHILNFVYCFYPDTVQPRSWLLYKGTDTATAVNTAFVPNEPADTKELGRYIDPLEMPYTKQCFYLYLADDLRNGFLNKDLEYFKEDGTFVIEYNSGNHEKEIYYDSDRFYLVLLIDGEIQPAFGGEYSYLVDCEDGASTFKYEIPSDILPTSGTHTIQCIAIPADECEHSGGEATPRIRIAALG